MGGGFCEIHGPFDPPYQTCPYCAWEGDQRRTYGPPPGAVPRMPEDFPSEPPDTGFVRQTVEPGPKTGDLTEVVPRARGLDQEEIPERAEPEQPLLGWLIVKEPPEHRGTVLAVQANQSIGREGDVQWSDPHLSRQHARLTVEPPEDDPDGPAVFHLWPFGPTNPVYINGRQVRGATPLVENDEIRLGDTLFVFKVLAD
jgi:hypothetical protein